MIIVGVAQPGCVALDVMGNAAAHARIVRDAGARVVVFPEPSLTGGYTATAGRSGVWSAAGVPLAAAGPEPGAFAVVSLR